MMKMKNEKLVLTEQKIKLCPIAEELHISKRNKNQCVLGPVSAQADRQVTTG